MNYLNYQIQKILKSFNFVSAKALKCFTYDRRLHEIWNQILPPVGSDLKSIFDPVLTEIKDGPQKGTKLLTNLKIKENFICPEELGEDGRRYIEEEIMPLVLRVLLTRAYDTQKGIYTGCPMCKTRSARNIVLKKIKKIYNPLYNKEKVI